MKKRKNFISVLLTVVLLVCGATVFVLADEGVITREEFFNSIVKVLGLEPSETMSKSFSDSETIAPEYYGNIAAGVNKGLFLGKTDGSLGPKEVLTVKDMEYVLSRIDFSPKTVTKYVSGGTRIVEKRVEVPVEVEKIVEVPVEVEKIVEVSVTCDKETGSHIFEFDATKGCYVCLCDEKIEAPVGTSKINRKHDSYDYESLGLNGTISDEGSSFYADDACLATSDNYLEITCDADLYEMVDGEMKELGFVELFYKYGLTDDSPMYKVHYALDQNGLVNWLLVDGVVE